MLFQMFFTFSKNLLKRRDAEQLFLSYDRSDNFPFDYKPNGSPFGSWFLSIQIEYRNIHLPEKYAEKYLQTTTLESNESSLKFVV